MRPQPDYVSALALSRYEESKYERSINGHVRSGEGKIPLMKKFQ